MLKKIFVGAMALTLPASATAAEAQDCITRSEISSMMAFALPSLIGAVRTRCVRQLSPVGFLAREGEAMEARYTAAKKDTWPLARAAFSKFAQDDASDDAAVMASLPDSALQPMVEAMLPAMAAGAIKPEGCRDVEAVLEALAPLPPENTAHLFGSIMGLVGAPNGKAGKKGPGICPIEQG